jgi:hypothetical protein
MGRVSDFLVVSMEVVLVIAAVNSRVNPSDAFFAASALWYNLGRSAGRRVPAIADRSGALKRGQGMAAGIGCQGRSRQRERVMKYAVGAVAVAVVILAAVLFIRLAPATPARDAGATDDSAKQREEIEALRAELKRVTELTPDQAAVMSHLSYHWGNLWFAIDQENWPLAEFYLSEVRANLKWAVRAKPIRKTKAGEVVDVKSIAESVDNGPFTQMKAAIAKKDKKACVAVYDDALTGCYSCHKASEKPYLRPQRPTEPEARVVNFDPNAKKPE